MRYSATTYDNVSARRFGLMNRSASASQELLIREARLEDLDNIVRMVNAGGPDGKARGELPAVLPPAYTDTFSRIETDANQKLMVAELDTQLVGTFHLTYIYYLAGVGRPDAQIEAIHVVENHRGEGIGSAMLHWAITEAKSKKCRRVQLTTDKKRSRAHAIYLRAGFKFTHEGAKLYLPDTL